MLASSWRSRVTVVFRWGKAQKEGLAAINKEADPRPGGRPVKHIHGPVATLPMPKKTPAATKEAQVITSAQ